MQTLEYVGSSRGYISAPNVSKFMVSFWKAHDKGSSFLAVYTVRDLSFIPTSTNLHGFWVGDCKPVRPFIRL